MTYSVNIATDNLIGIKELANSEANIKELLMKASRSELLLYVALRPHSATLKAIRSHENPRQSSFKTKDVFYAPLLPHYARLMAEFGEAVIEQYEASVEGKAPLDWHYWMLDAPQTVTTEQVKIDKTLIEALPITQSDTAPAKAVQENVIKKNKLNRNELDPAIDEAIKQAGNMHLADVFLKLKDLAINEYAPFTGVIEKNSLFYTNSNDNDEDKLTKNALGKRLEIRRNNAV